MKNWKTVFTGFFVFCLLVFVPFTLVRAEEQEPQEETEEALPDSYYYSIESNEIKDWPQGPAIEAAAATVMDMDSGTVLYSKNATSKQYPASTTKIMTTLLLVENCNLDDEITFSEIVYDLEEGSSHLGIQAGEKMKLRDVAYGIMLASANDMANGVAEYMGGSLSGFADMMNAKAQELGCVNTHFSNPHGLFSEDHYTCAYDMALIARAAYSNPTFREIACTREYTIPKTNLVDEERSFRNHQKMMHSDEEYYRSYCTGGKTGFTSECLNTLVTYGEQDGRSLVSVILRVNGAGKAYEESADILEYGFDNFSTTKYVGSSSSRTFYDMMGLHYLGRASEYQSDVWKRQVASDLYGIITLPDTADRKQVTSQVVSQNGNSVSVSYQYEGTTVGASRGTFYPAFAPAQLLFEKKAEVPLADAKEAVSEKNIQMENLNDVLTRTSEMFTSGYGAFKSYTQNHFTTVVVAGAVILVVLIALIVILIFRCTSDLRIRRKRKQEALQRKRREEEIERMTTAEIEAELRAVMEQERIRREREMQAEAEAVRAAEEAKRLEEEAHATERLIQELEDERQERLKDKQ